MPKKITITVYAYGELSDAAKKAAVRSMREQLPNKRIAETDDEIIEWAQQHHITFDIDGRVVL